MSICFNSLQLTASPDTAQRLLSKGFEDCDLDDWGLTPQHFSFKPFLQSLSPDRAHECANEIEQIWTNWIDGEQNAASHDGIQKLTIEFESEEVPPLRTIQAMIEWMQQQAFTFELDYRYRQENQEWQGELKAHNEPLH